MEITCGSCQKKMNIPDEKVPKGKSFRIKCPSCKEEISVNASASAASDAEGPGAADTLDAAAGDKGALVCDKDAAILTKVAQQLGYMAHSGKDHNVAKNNMRFNDYSLIILTEDFDKMPHDGDDMLDHLKRMKMDKRRHIFVVYIVSGQKSFDRMQEFGMSVNCIISKDDFDAKKEGVAQLIKKRLTEWESAYKIYKESMVKMGKA